MVLFALELRISYLAALLVTCKEVLERFAEIGEGPLHSTLRGLIGPRELLTANGVELLFECTGIRLSSGPMLLFPFR